MRARKVVVVMLWMAIAVAGAGTMVAKAQEPAKAKPDDPNVAYKLDYVIAEIENGKRVNTRTYTLLTDEGGSTSMRMGMRVPLQGEKGPIYMDVGLRVDSRVRPREGNSVWLSTRFEVSSLAEQPQTVNGAMPVRSVEYSNPAVVTLGKSTVLAAGDELTSAKRFELSVTVTKVQ